MKNLTALLALLFVITGCAGLNPNPGERTVDNAWAYGDYNRVHTSLRPPAERGEPWAQLRLGVAYELGVGVEKDLNQAVKWYTKAALQEGSGAWAEGQIVGAAGKAGYFSQKNDALIAQHRLANIYLAGGTISSDYLKAYLLELHVSKESNGSSIFYYHHPNGQDMYISSKEISNTLFAIENKLGPNQKAKAQEQLNSWSIKNVLQPIK